MIDRETPPVVVQVLWTTAWLAVPVTTLVSLVRLHAARFDLRDVVAALDADVPPLGLRDAMARALGDPSAQLGFWVPELAEHRDVEGRAIEVGPRRAITPLGPRTSGVPPAILVHDAALLEDDGLLDAVAGAAVLALEHERLHAEVRTRLAEVRRAQARLVETEDAARRRSERDLHDGAQQTLVSLALALRMLEDALDPEADAEALPHLHKATAAADAALDQLRELARGMYPAVLELDGLGAALEELAVRTALAVQLRNELGDRRAEPAIEAAAFFVTREALRNADAHAGATAASVTVRGDGDLLTVEVADDGRGGAALRERGGLRHLADRVSALGGRLDVRPATPHGTVLRAELPWSADAAYAASPSAAASAPADSWSLRTNGSPLSRRRVP